MKTIPVYDGDLFSEQGILDPYPHYKAIRDLGPVVHLSASDVPTVSRYDDVRAVLMDKERFISGKGVTLNNAVNGLGAGTTLMSDPPQHTQLRSVLIKPMTPKALAEMTDRVQAEADGLIDRLVEKGSFDGVKDLAMYLPITIVSILVGLPEDVRGNMLEWAAASFDSFGPMNDRVQGSLKVSMGVMEFLGKVSRDIVLPGSWADQLYEAVDQGHIDMDSLRPMLIDYITPALDTTIAGTSQFLNQFGQNPDQWDLLINDPSLIRNAIEETLRIESPIRGFARVAAEDVKVAGVPVPKDTRLLILYGAANRDERKWDDAGKFDIQRSDVRKHMAFGFGIHQCAGQHLARLEMTCLLNAMVTRVKRIEATNAEYAVNSALRVLSKLDTTFH